MTSEVRGFMEIFQPNEWGYYKKPYNWTWYFEDKVLFPLLLQHAIDGRCVIGIRTYDLTRVLGVDVDDHDTGGWIKGTTSGSLVGEMTPTLRDRYERACAALPLEPSVKVKSPRGIHLFWFLQNIQHSKAITAFAKESFGHLGRRIEILPTMSEAIRIPKRSAIIEPGTGANRLYDRRIHRDIEIDWSLFHCYSFEQLRNSRVTVKTSQVVYKVRKDSDTVAEDTAVYNEECDPVSRDLSLNTEMPKSKTEAEAIATPFSNGDTNWQLWCMVYGGKHEGMDLDDIKVWISDWIDESRRYGYTGPLGNNQSHLEKRINNAYKKIHVSRLRYKDVWDRYKAEVEGFPGDSQEAFDQLRCINHFRQRQLMSVKKFLDYFYRWVAILELLDELDPEAAEQLAIYPNHTEYYSKGWIPLPSDLMKSWYDSYREVLNFLEEKDFLVPMTSFNRDTGQPRWYRRAYPTTTGMYIPDNREPV